MSENPKEDVTDNTEETDALLEPQLEALRGHKRECALAIVLCFGAGLGDFIRWILLLVFHDKLKAYYYNNINLKGIVTGSICWDFVCFTICVGIYYLHKRWIQLPNYINWKRFFVLRIAIATRLFMMTPIVFGNSQSSRGLQGFVFIIQILYYFFVILAWIRPIAAYITGLHLFYSELTQVSMMESKFESPSQPTVYIQPDTPRPQVREPPLSSPPLVSLVDSEVGSMIMSEVNEQTPFFTPPQNESL